MSSVALLNTWIQKYHLKPPTFEYFTEGSLFACTITVEFEGNQLRSGSQYFPTKKAAKDDACTNFMKSYPEVMVFKCEDEVNTNREDFISALNVYCQKNRLPMPEYTMTPIGMGFTCAVTVDTGLYGVLRDDLFPAAFSSKKLAKAAAASRMLERIRAHSSVDTMTEEVVDTYSKILEDDPETGELGLFSSSPALYGTIGSGRGVAVTPPPGFLTPGSDSASERKRVGEGFSKLDPPVIELNYMQQSPFKSSILQPLTKSKHSFATSSEVSYVDVVEEHPMQKLRSWCAVHGIPEPTLNQSQDKGYFRCNLKIKLNGCSYSLSSDSCTKSQDDAERSAARKAMTFIATQIPK